VSIIAESFPVKQGLRHLLSSFYYHLNFYCREFSSKTRIATVLPDVQLEPSQYCREFSSKTRIATSVEQNNILRRRDCREFSSKTRIATIVFSGCALTVSVIAESFPVKQGLRLSVHIFDLFLSFINIAESFPVKQGLRHHLSVHIFDLLFYCREFSSKTRIATLSNGRLEGL